MKKTMIILTAMASMMTACTNDETLDVVSSQPIAFTNAFIENSTRAAIDGSYTMMDKLTAFQVYGTITNSKNETANIFNGTNVTYKNSGWSYDNLQYWIENNTYNFTAIVDGNEKNGETEVTKVTTDETGMPSSITLNDITQQKDILYATAKAENVTASYSDEVSFTFSHLLAKAMFTVENTITNTNYAYKVSDIKITNAVKSATYGISYSTWTATTPAESQKNECELSFGNAVQSGTETGADADYIVCSSENSNPGMESNYERLLIPGTYGGTESGNWAALNITFTADLYVADNMVTEADKDKFKKFHTKSVIVQPTTAVELKAGHSYNFVIKLGNPGSPITFTVQEVKSWNTDHNDDNTTDDKDDVNTSEKTE